MKINQQTVSGPSFSIKNRFLRVIWTVANLFLFKYSPKPCHRWRAFILRIFGATVGNGTHIYPKVIIWAPWNLTLHDQCGIANHVNLYSQGKIVIGKRAVISQGAHICTGTHDYTRIGFPLITKSIIIHDFAWVAAEVFIHPGVIIGEGAVIGARSVVTKDMPPYMICSGFPCKPLKERIIEG